jgi:CheY-like chemotaxis protein
VSRKVVVIDDDDDDIIILSEALRNLDDNLIISAFTDSEHACNELSKHYGDKPDYIFIDINMPRIMGPECLVMIRSNKHLEDSKVVMISTTMWEREAIKYVSNVADYAVQKPVRVSDYEGLLRKIMQR